MRQLEKKLTLSVLLGAMLLLHPPVSAQETLDYYEPKVEIFMGADLLYRDIFHDKIYEAVVNLTPGVKWNMGHHWQVAGQAIVPVYNDYGDRYKKVRLNMAVLSKQWFYRDRHFLKVSTGLFGMERYGVDVKWMSIVTPWLALDAQVGLTGFCSMAADWECSEMTRFSGWAGFRVYLDCAQTEFRVRGGRYVYEDYGGRVDIMRHFKHCTVGVYMQYNDMDKENGGFKVTMMIPPYKRRAKKVQIRPASNFCFTHNFKGTEYAVKTYQTDPEENDREGDFSRDRVRWGANTLPVDYVYKKKGGKR